MSELLAQQAVLIDAGKTGAEIDAIEKKKEELQNILIDIGESHRKQMEELHA